MASSVSKLCSVTILPNTVYCPSRKLEFWWTMKNCDPALLGSWLLAIETMPRSCGMSLNSASTECGGPPIPHVRGSPLTVLGSPPCIINPDMIL